MTPATDSPTTALRRSLAMRGLRAVLIATVLTLIFALLFSRQPVPTVVVSLCITLGCWACIDGGRVLVAKLLHPDDPPDSPRRRWPGWGWMSGILAIGTILGFSIGSIAGQWLLGQPLGDVFGHGTRPMLAWMAFSLIPGFAATFFFWSRERIASTEARALAAQREASESQLRLLQSQLEPHMLFNTLANLRVLIALDPPRAQAMLDQLIAFLRATLAASRSGRHALSAEFERIGDYLALMQVRMGERLQTRLDLPDALAGVAIPPLLLQPLVENAIKHGLEPKVDGGRIDVTALRDGDQLVLQVRDTGVGLAPTPADGGTHFGLQQVRERLATQYGGAAALQMAAADDAQGGTVATIRLPLEP